MFEVVKVELWQSNTYMFCMPKIDLLNLEHQFVNHKICTKGRIEQYSVPRSVRELLRVSTISHIRRINASYIYDRMLK